MADNRLIIELAKRLNGVAVVSSDVKEEDIKGIEIESLTAYIVDYFKDKSKPGVLDKATLTGILDVKKSAAMPQIEIEVLGNASFKPVGKGSDLRFSIRSIKAEKTAGDVNDFARYFSDRLRKLKDIIQHGRNAKLGGMINSVQSLGQYVNSREVTIAGLVYDKKITKNGHVLVTIDDETGSAKILFPRPERNVTPEVLAMFDEAQKIVLDEVIAVRGKLSGDSSSKDPFLIAYYLARPDIPIHQRRTCEEELGIAFMSDTHFGSRLFLDKQFTKFLEWINGSLDYNKAAAEKVRALVISGDLVDGIGVYPNQQKELAVDDIYKQYAMLFESLSKIPEYVHIFVLTGNHDAVQRAEPQPVLPNELTSGLRQSNMHLVSNPGYVTIEGIRILSYHGTSLDSVIQGIQGCSYSKPETAMVELLKRRHLSPIYGDNPIVPSRVDQMVMEDVPDILHMGHLHKNGYSDYHGTLVINSGTWQARTSYQQKLGHMPTPAMLPVYDAHKGTLSALDFNSATE
ncbi:MAG: DNA-directed DNA polymerase II small subunit [Candidatus Micrarchaeota archaeon]|nr:DNA-directed DNA polymerase II small subunit [Candidatus Micrarchaeota archaeon]